MLDYLADNGAHFVKVKQGEKFPIEQGWQDKPKTLVEMEEHLGTGGSIGLLCGQHSDNIGLLDIDENLTDFLDTYPKTHYE